METDDFKQKGATANGSSSWPLSKKEAQPRRLVILSRPKVGEGSQREGLLHNQTRAFLLSTFNCRLWTRLYRFTRKSRPVISAGAGCPNTPSIVGAMSRSEPPGCNGV